MTTPTIDAPEPDTGSRRRRPAPPANAFFRYGFPLLVLAAALIVVVLWRDGAKAVLDSTDGEDFSPVDDPAEAGFLAFATPTPTLLVAHVDGDDALVGVTVLARTTLDEGGALIIYSPDMLVDLSGDDVILDELYAAEGAEGLERAIGEYMGFGFTDDPMLMDEARLAEFLTLVEPIPYFLADDLVRVDESGTEQIVHPSGNGTFRGEELAEIYRWRNPAERDDGRFTRQLAVWQAWLGQVGEVEGEDDLIRVTLPFDAGLPPYLRAFATGTADLEVVPAVPYDLGGGDPIYALGDDDTDWPRETGRRIVPLPVAYAAGVWPTVQLLDGTGDAAVRDAFLPAVVAAGAEITVIGNAPTFGIAETFVAYHDVVDEAPAIDLADSLGVSVRFDEQLDHPAQLTVTVGADSADLSASLSE
ncbi:MAG: hypothetical protein RIB98_16180 [Acidimicrobiales bacterium]